MPRHSKKSVHAGKKKGWGRHAGVASPCPGRTHGRVSGVWAFFAEFTGKPEGLREQAGRLSYSARACHFCGSG